MLIDYQKYAFDKIIEYDKSIIIWPRQSGKSLLINKAIENFVINNNNKKIIFIADSDKFFSHSISRIQNDINGVVVKWSKNGISFINNNKLIFLSINNDIFSSLSHYNPNLIVVDSYTGMSNKKNNISTLNMYLSCTNCKFVSTFSYDINVITSLDINNDFYINILPYYKNDKNYDNFYNIKSQNNKIKSNILNDLSYKPHHLLDYYDTSFIRKKKIQILNSLNSI